MLIGPLVALAAAVVLLTAKPDEPSDADVRADLVAMIREAAPRERLEAAIAGALDHDVPEEAEEYFEVADLVGVPVDPALRSRWADETSGWRTASRSVRRAATGFVTGEGEDAVGMAAALASDLTVVGDVRDLAGQASRMIRGEAVDELTLGLSIAGVALTVGTVATAGGALPAKAGVSLTKLARKTGRLTATFQAELGRVVARSMDVPAFRQAVRGVPWYRLDDLAVVARRHAARVDVAEARKLLSSVGAISQTTSPARTLAILRHVDDVRDVQKAERAATLLGKPVSGAFRLTGKKVLATVVRAGALSAMALGALLTLAGGVLSFMVGALMTLATLWRLGKVGRWTVRNAVRPLRWPARGT
ncbi:hypothetical protein FBZ82_104376 [Azospirillum brasilense]|uniref:Uncharacterized protein n=1 Tax=Azospirillum brasilense TaxID=192 RepID=A0A560BCA0_AZOBR|nr:hypothetical protein [Azospirillum brasilense]TWA70216.1 hypothetical protein FBZ82_104376 [Azospirillum brasilense]